MRSEGLRELLQVLSYALESAGCLVVYGRAGSLRTSLALLLSAKNAPFGYLGVGRHARLSRAPIGVTLYRTTSFREELEIVFDLLGFVKRGYIKGFTLDELLANLAPYRASISESHVARMFLIEIHLLRLAMENAGKVIAVAAEDPRSGGPLALKYLRQLKPRLVRASVEGEKLVVEERDPGDPLLALRQMELLASEVVTSCEVLLQS